MNIQPALDLMTDYFADKRLIDHTMKVLAEAEALLAAGAADPAGAASSARAAHPAAARDEDTETIVRLSCIFHDIGIPGAIEKHGSSAGPFQEREGAVVAETLLSRLDLDRAIHDRVRFIVGHHHSREAIDGPDFRVLWDADMLVNLAQGNVVPDRPIEQFIAEEFETGAGAERAREKFAAH